MSSKKELINCLINDVTQLRDELRLKVNLGALEMEVEIAKLDDKYELFKSKSKEILEVADESADELVVVTQLGIDADNKEDVLTALKLAGEEIKDSYEKIKKII